MALADYRTFFTFSQPLAVPGATLPAGKYLFRVPGESSTRDVVQILSADGRKALALFFAHRPQRKDTPSDPEIRFLETTQGLPSAVKSWWYPGSRTGYEFIYPKSQARLLAQGTGQPVLTTQAETTTAATTDTGELARVSPAGEQPARPGEGFAAGLEETGLKGEIAPLSIVVSEAAEARVTLPRLAAVTLLVAGAITFLAVIRKRRAYVVEEP